MVIVEDQIHSSLSKIIKKGKQVAVIPVGSVEQHGPHLPVSTDSDIVTDIAKKLSKKMDFLLLPTITYGVSFEHAPFFNLSIKPLTLQKLLSEICLSLLSNGIRTAFVINGHYGNKRALRGLSKRVNILSKGNMRVFVLPYWSFMKQHFDHAGYVETSLMLAVSNKVKMRLAKKGLIIDGLTSKEISKIKKLASISFPKATKNGVWGDPTRSSKEEGIKMITEIIKNLEKKCQTCLTDKNPKLHQ